MCTAGQRVSLTITGPGPSFFSIFFPFFSVSVFLSFSFILLLVVCDGLLSIADYNSTLMGVGIVIVVVVVNFTMG